MIARTLATGFVICLIVGSMLVGSPQSVQAAEPTTVTITLSESGFEPAVLTVTTGTEVTWHNTTGATYVLQSVNSIPLFIPVVSNDSPSQSDGSADETDRFSFVLEEADTSNTPPLGNYAQFGFSDNRDTFSATLPPDGTFSYVFTTPGDYSYQLLSEPRFSGKIIVSERLVSYRGSELVLIEKVPSSFGAGAKVSFDIDGDGAYEQQVTADEDGLYTISLDTTGLPADSTFAKLIRSADGASETGRILIRALREDSFDPADAVPTNLLTASGTAGGPSAASLFEEPSICTCIDCPPYETLAGASLDAFTETFTPSEYGVDLATGLLRRQFPIAGFATRRLGFDLGLHHASLVDYDGPWGRSVSHSFNMMIVQTGPQSGLIVTPDMRVYETVSEDGEIWTLPTGFFSRLRLDPAQRRWTLTHFSGLEVVFYQAIANLPGYPITIREPNGNATRLVYDPSGLLQAIHTDLDQVQTFGYNGDGRLASFSDHMGRTWGFTLDTGHRLTAIVAPETEFAQVEPGVEVTESVLEEALVTQARVTTLGYTDPNYPHHLTSITDPRGATAYAWTYDNGGRVSIATINGKNVSFIYGPVANPAPQARLEANNLITRIIDREGNISDYEIHSGSGGPLDGLGRYGIRRIVTWTELGKGNEPLREGEPAYWEQRWLHDCNCLAPQIVVQPFSNVDALELEFDGNGIPANWPRRIYTYNDHRQVVVDLYTDGVESIRSELAYQALGFGETPAAASGDSFVFSSATGPQFSRLISHTDPRAFDPNPIYAGLDWEHTFHYDDHGNLVQYDAPTITRGVASAQSVREIWTYNAFGQVLSHTDPNGNVTAYTYFDGQGSGGDINTKGTFGGYVASVSRGTAGSADPITDLTKMYRVNALGLVTQMSDPNGHVHDFTYNDLGELVQVEKPAVTLRNGSQVRYETRAVYDGAGNVVLERRSNVDVDGSTPAKAWIDRALTYDGVNNLLSERAQVDADEANDLITRYAYDGNDDLAVIQKPEGNLTFRLYDERRLLFKTFYGVAPGATLFAGYPVDKRAQSLMGTEFVGLTIETYDARLNHVRSRDGRGYDTDRFFDFYNRQVAESDPNGNGWVHTYDAASNVLTTARGMVSKTDGTIAPALERTYFRFDELGRSYQTVLDIDLTNNEQAQIDPKGADNAGYATVFDTGSRVVAHVDPNDNATTYAYDAADRLLTTTDTVGNSQTYTYDANSNITSLAETEVAGPGATGAPETYVTTFVYDELNRLTAEHVRGLNGNSLDHATFFAYDSRGNLRLEQDAGNNYTLMGYDDLDRRLEIRRFDGDPLAGTPVELARRAVVYDRNSRVAEDLAFSDVNMPNSVQTTRYAYDHDDRVIRVIYPDSDDPLIGDGHGNDGIFDRVEVVYDENANPITVTEQRGVVFHNTFDAGNRVVEQEIAHPVGVPGVTRQVFEYDALDRLITAQNDYAQVERTYDPLSRLITETQSIRLDGSGFTNGWEFPIVVAGRFDRADNRTTYRVLDGMQTDLRVDTNYDALNRVDDITAQYFDVSGRPIAGYAYIGPKRVQTKTLGNGAKVTRVYDAKRRVLSHHWTGHAGTLVGFEYGYDRMDNVLYERFLHDNGLYDHFIYNGRYELVGVEYRSADTMPPVSSRDTFAYDDLFNRTAADFGAPFDAMSTTGDLYTAGSFNEYTQITRNGDVLNLAHDLAGNMTHLLVRPVTGMPDQEDVIASARWDAFNMLFDLESGASPQQHYRYDPFLRRIATLELSGEDINDGSRRYIYDGWSVVQERLFSGDATTASAPSALERVYVNGPGIDEPLLVAIDRDGSGQLGGANDKNVRDIGADQEYYFLDNRLGNIMGLLDADNPARMLEYYRYTVYGEATVLPVVDNNNDELEDTPLDLADNFGLGPQRISEEFGNVYFFTARRFDHNTGLYHYRHRYYEARTGRFVSRDPIGFVDGMNVYQYVRNSPLTATDPFGLSRSRKEGEECCLKSEVAWRANGWPSVEDCVSACMADSWERTAKLRRWRLPGPKGPMMLLAVNVTALVSSAAGCGLGCRMMKCVHHGVWTKVERIVWEGRVAPHSSMCPEQQKADGHYQVIKWIDWVCRDPVNPR